MELNLTSFLEGSFSILVAAFLLLRIEKRMDELTAAITMLKHCQVCRHSPFIVIAEEPQAIDYNALPSAWTPPAKE